MGKNIKNKKLIHKLTWYTLERDDARETLEKYDLQFQKDFENELRFLQHKRSKEEAETTEQQPAENKEKDKRITEEMKELHKLFRNIAKKTHPDLHGDKFIEIFKSANEAFENKNWIDLITIAADLDIELPEFSDESIQLIDKNINELETQLDGWTNSICWIWVTRVEDIQKKYYDSEKTGEDILDCHYSKENLRKEARKILGIDEKEFEEFLNQLQ